MTASPRSTAKYVCASAALVLALLALPAPSAAHQASFTYARIEVSEGGRTADYQLRIDARDLYEALGLDTDREASNREIREGAERLLDYVFARVSLSAKGQECALERRGVRPVGDAGQRFAEVRARLRCPRPVGELHLDYDLFFDLDPTHTGLVTVDGRLAQLRYPDHDRLVFHAGEPGPSGALGFLRSGVDHILFGLDHILFLLSLLLVVVLTAGAGGPELRGRRATLVDTAALVTSFTVAHSLTLVAAALGWIALPSRLVESVIAASIVYVAVENLARVAPPRRHRLTFLFGLVHGLGFASMLRPLLPPEQVVAPLLAFNLGVELGQLAIVALALPALLALARALGPDRYRRWVLPAGCGALIALGLAWLTERALDVGLVPF